ncbi:MAG: low molecular weight protein-tyrosine-phosphatase [Bdellovibrionia bacterium]
MRILFVCLGNICRSPTAEAVFKKVATEMQLEWHIDSAGTNGYHNGENPDPRSIAIGKTRGYDVNSISRQVRPEDFEQFDYIFAMDSQNIRALKKFCPRPQLERKVHLVTDFGSEYYEGGVPDPYYGAEQDFHNVIDILEDCCKNIVSAIQAKRI